MFSQTHYLIRSKKDGQYLVARPRSGSPNEAGFILLFKEDYDALSYLNQHGADVAERFGVESIAGTQLKGLLQRWGFEGVGLVSDPLIPQIQFLTLK
ncbi:hypothetical protein [Oscillatoria sp. FACHB-1406]|uniref:hypothetical protein n=1 Tax=Oscillatoria sp. FACHB-1406 TaxID=2692846 RepID=UPI00168961B9|nr:hypothetical protein [Oscillatoria sp. FACHB-1406]MBD2578518.1 hypothetical protein [Oscillatoria sp. FACHB-1406]